MARVTLPAGSSLRDVAARLGLSVEDLQRRTGVGDVERPLAADLFVELPDGFLKARDRSRRSSYAAVPGTPTTKSAGMNAWLALDIERKRIERDGAKRKESSDTDEREAFEEADRTFARLDAASNELAIALYHRLTESAHSNTRARAYANEGLAHAYAHLLFGAPLTAAQPQALSCAKAALMANPKLPATHVALAAALRCEPTGQNLAEADAALADAAHHGASDVWFLYERARVLLARGQDQDARSAMMAALAAQPTFVLALELQAMLALPTEGAQRAEELLRTASAAAPTYSNTAARRVGLLRQLGRIAEAETAEAEVLAACEREAHRTHLLALMADPTAL